MPPGSQKIKNNYYIENTTLSTFLVHAKLRSNSKSEYFLLGDLCTLLKHKIALGVAVLARQDNGSDSSFILEL
jgi:hypothetical protein